MRTTRFHVLEMSDLSLTDAQLADLIEEVIEASTRLTSEIKRGTSPSVALKRSARPNGHRRLTSPIRTGDIAWQKPVGGSVDRSECSYFSTYKPLINSANPLLTLQYKTNSDCFAKYDDRVETFEDGSQCYQITFVDRHRGAFGYESLTVKLTAWLKDGRVVAHHVDRKLKSSGMRPEYRC